MPKLPPQNIDAEESVLGGLMIDKNAIIRVADVLRPGDFYKPIHNIIYGAILKLFEKSQPIDILTITGVLKDAGELETIGGATYITSLTDKVPTASHIEHYAKLVKEKKVLRDLINTSAEISESVFASPEDIEQLLDQIESKIFAISQGSINQKFIPVRDELKAAFERMEKLHNGEGGLRGIPTGFNQLDNLLSGFQKSDLVVIGARPSVGKTSLVLGMMAHAAIKHNVPVGIFSIEMSREQVIDRIIAAEAGVALWKLRTGKLRDEHDFELIQHSLDTLSRAPIYVDDTPSPTILQMRAMARRLQAEHGLAMIVVDYLQLIQPRTNSDNIVSQITEISRGLKALARELNVPVIALSQLSRATEQRDSGIPRLSDLRDSGCLTGDTRIVRADTGELVTMQSLAERKKQLPIPVFSLDENWNIVIRPMTKVFRSGIKETFELRLRSGRTIKASANHPFRTPTGWSRLDALKTGDRLAIPQSMATTPTQEPLTADELLLHAHLLGDGCVLPKQPYHYTSADPVNLNIVENAAKNLFGVTARRVQQKNWWHSYLPSPYRLTHGRTHPITQWYQKLNIERVRAPQKQISPLVFQCSPDAIALFLRHLWATDGNISWKKLAGRKPAAAIYYASTSAVLAGQVQHLLTRLGIQSVIKTVPQGTHRPCYNVTINGKDQQMSFLEIVGCVGERAAIIRQLSAALEQITANPNTGTLPASLWQSMINTERVKQNMSWRDVAGALGTAYNGSALFKASISPARLDRVATALASPVLRQLAQAKVVWDEIAAITPLGRAETFDATVPGTHNFVANDIIVHNSIEQDADVVIFIYRKDRNKVGLDPLDENMAELIIAKHRNGPLGTVQVKFDPDTVTFRNLDTRHQS